MHKFQKIGEIKSRIAKGEGGESGRNFKITSRIGQIAYGLWKSTCVK